MTENYSKECEICGESSWEILLDNQMISVCSGREVIKDIPLVKGMCTNCGFVYTLRSPLDEDIDHYYKDVYSSKLRSDAYDYRNYSHGMTFSTEEFNLELIEEDTKGSKWRFLFKKVPDAGSQRKGELSAVVGRLRTESKVSLLPGNGCLMKLTGALPVC